MPNWCENLVIVKGSMEELNSFMSKHFIDEDNHGEKRKIFSFNTVYPMPESLNIESSSRVYDAVAYYFYCVHPSKRTDVYTSIKLWSIDMRKYLGKFRFTLSSYNTSKLLDTPIDVFIKHVGKDETLDSLFELGNTAVYNFKHYGVADWYDWRWSNWGTKWDCNFSGYSIEDCPDNADLKVLTMWFDTAWSPARGVYDKLFEMYPNLDIVCKYLELGCWFGGIYYPGEDEAIDESDLKRFAIEEFGYDGDWFEDEEEEDV